MSSSEDEYRPGSRGKAPRKVKNAKNSKTAAKPKVDPNRPKAPLSSYMRFVSAKRPQIKEENPGAGIGDIAKVAGKMWKEIDAEEKSIYEKAYQKDKKAWLKKMEDYEPPAGFAGSKRPKKDPNAPKKPMTAYFAWMNENRSRIKEDNPSATLGEVAKIAGKEWRDVDPDVKTDFETAYKSQMEDYKVAIKNYVPDKKFANGAASKKGATKGASKAAGSSKSKSKKSAEVYDSSEDEDADGASTSSLSEDQSSSRKKAKHNDSDSEST